jgi:antitoxin MazE
MHINVSKWGNSLGVRIPRVLANKIGIHEGTPVDVSIQENHIIISKGYSLESLLNEITPDNIHREVHIGPRCGKESW